MFAFNWLSIGHLRFSFRRELKPALDARSCHITNIEPLAP